MLVWGDMTTVSPRRDCMIKLLDVRADTPCLLGRQVSDAEPCSSTNGDYWLLSMRRSESFVDFPAFYLAQRWPLLHGTASIKL
jgi:hypothetical protein